MPTIRWSNGAVDKAATWEELLDRVRALQWNGGMPEDEFRSVLATRAYRWSLIKVDPTLPADAFFRDLAYAKLIEILPD